MSNNGNKNGKKGALGTIVTLLVAAVVYLVSGNLDGMQDTQSTEQTQNSYESQVIQDNKDDAEQSSETADSEKEEEQEETSAVTYSFRNESLLESHYEKHGIEMGFDSAEEYEAAANRVVNNPDALYKLESEDNDHVYYLEETNEFVVVSQDGYIRTYFLPGRGIDYFNAQ